MSDFILAIKITGILLSSISIIGKQRLIRIEGKIREFLEWKNIKGRFLQLIGDRTEPNWFLVILTGILIGIGIYSLGIIYLTPAIQNNHVLSRITTILSTCIPVLMLLFLAMHFAIQRFLSERIAKSINGRRIPSRGFRDFSMDTKERNLTKKQNHIFQKTEPFGTYLRNIVSRFVLFFYLILLVLVMFPAILLLLVAGGIGIPFLLGVIYGIRLSIYVLSAIIWLLSRPYIWLDKQVQQRKLESTLAFIGIVIAIVGELLGRFTH